MDSELVAVALTYGPSEQITTWKQRAMGNVLERWEVERSADFERVLYSQDTGYLIDIHPQCNGLGQYGWDSDFTLDVGVDEDLLEQTDNGDGYQESLYAYANALEDELCTVVTETQERSQFSPKEFVAFLLYQRDDIGERQAADALDVTVGTYRGKLGRIREKIEAARLTMELMDVTESENERRSEGRGYRSYGNLMDVFDADEYPAEGLLRDDIIQVLRNFINVREHQEGVVHYDTVIDELPDRFEDEEVSYYRARYELERAIDKGVVERDGNVVTVSE